MTLQELAKQLSKVKDLRVNKCYEALYTHGFDASHFKELSWYLNTIYYRRKRR